MRIHTGERPYRCTVCDRSSSSPGILQRHMRTNSGERPYPCSYCGKSFATSSNLKAQIAVHTRERPYPCSFCGKSFSQKGSANLHMNKFHIGKDQIKKWYPYVSTRSTLRSLLKTILSFFNWAKHTSPINNINQFKVNLLKQFFLPLQMLVEKETFINCFDFILRLAIH